MWVFCSGYCLKVFLFCVGVTGLCGCLSSGSGLSRCSCLCWCLCFSSRSRGCLCRCFSLCSS